MRRIKIELVFAGGLLLALAGCANTPLKDLEVDAGKLEQSISTLEGEGFSCWRQPNFVSCSRKRGNPFCPDIDHVMFKFPIPTLSKYTQQRTCRQ